MTEDEVAEPAGGRCRSIPPVRPQRWSRCGFAGVAGGLTDSADGRSEHIPRPEVLLGQIKPLLKAEADRGFGSQCGQSDRALMLLLGRWNYTDRGILTDALTLFHTEDSQELLESQGFKVERMLMTVMPVELVPGLPPDRG